MNTSNKRFTDIFIERPVLATVVNLVLMLAGIISLSFLAIREFPRIDATVISIATSYPGASSDVMETQVTNPIENSLAGVEGLDYLISENTMGNSEIRAYFNLGYNLNAAVADVINKISAVRKQLPKDINDPIIDKQDPNSSPILFVSFSDPIMQRVAVHDYLTRAVIPLISTIPGVGNAKIFGQLSYAMRIWLDPWQMASRNITVDDIKNALTDSNVQAATGRIESNTQEIATALNSQLIDPKQFDHLVIRQDNGIPIRISDIGHSELGTPEIRVNTLINEQNANVIGIIPRSDANPLSVAASTKNLLKRITSQLPTGMKVQVVWDNARFISASLTEVKKSIIESAFCVILVIFIFLGSWRTILIPAVTIPLSLIAVFTPMYAMGYSINTLTLLALVLAIGMVVDDAIVVSENIHRNIENGLPRFEAALVGAREIAFAIIVMTFTLATVYAPIIFMQGLTGNLFKEFAFTLAATVIISGGIALTLSPMMCARILPEKGSANRLEQYAHNFTEWLASRYQELLERTLHHRKRVFSVVGGVVMLGGILFYLLPSELAPKEDIGGVMVLMKGPSSASLAYTQKYALQVDELIKQIPEVSSRILITGIPDGVNTALMFLPLQDWSKRKHSADQIINSLFAPFSKITGLIPMPVNPFKLPGSTSLMPLEFVIKSTGDYAQLYKVAQEIIADATKNPALSNIDSDLNYDQPETSIQINRDLAADLGVSISDIGDTINLALSELQFNQFTMDGHSYYVIPQLSQQFRNTPDALNHLYIRAANNSLIPLSSLVTLKETVIPESLNHFQQMRAVTFTGSPAPNHTLGQALQAIEQISKKYMTPNMSYDFSGQTRQFMAAQDAMGNTFIFALLFIFLVLAAQFESFKDPLIVMFTVPLSMTGALLVLKLFGGSLNIYTQIGLITLIGLISKHGILMVEFANQLQERGQSRFEAIVNAASIRLRPVLMTTAAMVLGAIPLVLANGAGAESRHQIGLVIIGGMTVGTLLTLFVIPTVYLLKNNKNEYTHTTSSNIARS